MKRKKKKKKIIIIMGKTSSKKDTVCKYLQDEYDIIMIVSITTRPMRFYEVNGKEHYYVTDEIMDEIEKQKEKCFYF